jgi:hypothetical protein
VKYYFGNSWQVTPPVMKMSLDSEEDFNLGQVSAMLMPWLATKKAEAVAISGCKRKKAWMWFPVFTCALAACNLSLVCKNE